MLKNSIKRKVLVSVSILTILFCVGCSSSDSEKELAAFSQSITNFSDYMSNMDEKISGIDYESTSASTDLLSYLDDMNSAFIKLAEMEVPEQYSAISSLADEASENMNQAVSLYHAALEADEFNEQDAEIAYQYYTRAMTRISYIGTILKGEIPEGDNVTVHETSASNELIEKITE